MTLSAQKMVFIALLSELIFLILLPSVLSSTDHDHETIPKIRSSNKKKIHKISPELSFQVRLHGFILWASVGFLMPVAIIIKRTSNREQSGKWLRIIFYGHAITQVLAVLLATAGAILSTKYFDNSFNNDHQRIGLAFYGIIWVQALSGIFKPYRGSRNRSIWFIFHWLMGIAVSLLGIINIYTGLQAYHKRTSKDVRIWTMIFTVEISLILFIYLLQEKWHYIKKQGVILRNDSVRPTDQEISTRSQQKEISNVMRLM